MNRNLKALGRLCGIDGEVVIETTKGGRLMAYKRPKYEMIKTHTEGVHFARMPIYQEWIL